MPNEKGSMLGPYKCTVGRTREGDVGRCRCEETQASNPNGMRSKLHLPWAAWEGSAKVVRQTRRVVWSGSRKVRHM